MARSKKEIDKELMYKKLMPTANVAAETAETPENEALPKASATQPGPTLAETQTPLAPQPPVNTAAATSAPASAPTDKTPDTSAAAAAIVSGTVPAEEGELVNVMELLVNARIDSAMEKFRCCTCDKCKKDVTAITLNKLVPCYILRTDEAKRTEAEAKFAGQVATGLVQAILTVKARPTHE